MQADLFDAPPNSDRVCYVCESAGHFKIGMTLRGSLARRLEMLGTGNPYPIRLIGVFPLRDGETDRDIHAGFAIWRVTGEWFQKTEHTVAVVSRLVEHRGGQLVAQWSDENAPPLTRRQAQILRRAERLERA